ncbi:MAG: ABC transporter permease subunit [Gemmataceae bacterium]|nr:ABC transporter permease subunit [Gemmataceae bacterium]
MTTDLARLGRLTRKELSEILRDRRTIITLVLMPILLYPLLSVAFRQFFLASRLTPGQGIEYRLGFVSKDELELFTFRLLDGERRLNARSLGPSAKVPPASTAAPDGESLVSALVAPLEELDASLHSGRIDAIVRLMDSGNDKSLPPGPEQLLNFEIIYLQRSAGAHGVLTHIEERLAAANEADLRRRLNRSAIGRPSAVIRLLRAPVAHDAVGPMISLASLVPLILILMTITGAVYPAIDLTAGERERGTLEILVAAPVPRLGLLFAKYVTVVTVAVVTALVNLTAMTATLILSGLGPMLFGSQGLSAAVVIQMFGLLLLFAAFFSAVLLCITSFARSFKEAQAYLIPLMLVSLAPGVLGMLPGLHLSDWSVAPLVNIVLLGRDLLESRANAGTAAIVIVATLIYAAAAIALAARVFGAEGVLYSEQNTVGDLFRRPEAPGRCAAVSAALWCLALMIPLNFVLRGTAVLFARDGDLPDALRLWMTPAVSLLLFAALPGLFAWHGRVRLGSGFAMVAAPGLTLAGAIVLGISLWPLVLWPMSFLPEHALLGQNPEYVQESIEFVRRLTTPQRLVLVVVPAVLEEWFFRGYLYCALRRHLGGWTTILATGLLFGVAHWVLNFEFGFMRQLPSFAMGLALGAVREVSGSVWPGVLLHVGYNASLSLLLAQDTDLRITVEPWWVFAGAAGSALGAGLVWCGRVRAPDRTDGLE